MGNAEPTPATIATWIPPDGDFSVSTQSKYPIRQLPDSLFSEDEGSPFDNKGPDVHHFRRRAEKFDIIAIGMQEATFNLKEGARNIEKDVEQEVKQNEKIEGRKDGFSTVTMSLNTATYNQSNTRDDRKLNKSMPTVRNENRSASVVRRNKIRKSSFLSGISTSDVMYYATDKIITPLATVGNASLGIVNQATDKIIVIPLQTVGNVSLDVVNQATDKIVTPLHMIAADADHTKKSILLDHPATAFGGTKVLQKLIMSRCPSYDCPVHYQRGEMRLLILVRKDIAHLLEDVSCKAGNTGVGSFLPNKGGIKVTLTICKTRLSFVTAHLAAHEGPAYYASRCSNITNIFDQTRNDKLADPHDCTINSHHTFVFGDLNFRINLPNKEEIEHKKHVKDVFKLIVKRDWKALNAYDELLQAVEKGDCMVGFKTLPCHFPPTFKVKRAEGFAYHPERTPSYTDRILWKSSHGLKTDLLPILYEPCPSFNTSDHKAIRGAFSILPRDKDTLRSKRCAPFDIFVLHAHLLYSNRHILSITV